MWEGKAPPTAPLLDEYDCRAAQYPKAPSGVSRNDLYRLLIRGGGGPDPAVVPDRKMNQGRNKRQDDGRYPDRVIGLD